MKFNTFDTRRRARVNENEGIRARGREGGRKQGEGGYCEKRDAREREGGEGVRAAETHNECHS